MSGLFRSTLKSGSMLSGYYRYKDAFQIVISRKQSSITEGKYVDIEYNQAYSSQPPHEELSTDPDEIFYRDTWIFSRS